MTRAAEKVTHPYIASRRNYCGGSPIIKGTKFLVRSVVNYVLWYGFSAEELVKAFAQSARTAHGVPISVSL